MASFEVTGILRVKQNIHVVSDKFSKREFVITTDTETQYPQLITFQFTQDKCALLDSYNEGDSVKISFNLRGREWNGPQGVKYFNTLEAWRIEKFAGASAPAQTSQTQSAAPSAPIDVMPTSDVADDLPF